MHGLCQPCKETIKQIAHVCIIYSPNVECIRESWQLTAKTNKYVYIVTIKGGVWWRKEKFYTTFDIILKPNACTHQSLFCKVHTNPCKAICINLAKKPQNELHMHACIIYSPNVECIRESWRLTAKTNTCP